MRFLPLTGQEHAPSQDAAEAGHSGAFDLGEMLSHHILNGREYEFPGFVWHMPQMDPIHLGGLAIDLSLTKHTFLMLVAAAITMVVSLVVARTISRKHVTSAPSGFSNAIEAIVVFFRDDVCKGNIGHGYERFAPFILTLFFFILTMNLLGLMPWGGTATGNLSVTAALAIITFFVVEISGFIKLGAGGYARTIFFVPPGTEGIWKVVMLLVMTPVEFLSKLTKPFALAIRLFANMTAGHMLIFSLLGLIFVFGNMAYARWVVAGASFAMTSAIMMLELLVALIQAYIFAMLSAVFIGLMQHEH
ncbi:MAG: F0F1 ATP synthase subunit A [Gemmatimonadetes bacterium]|nr:F0F1 ATP synthase subunit A [Gemmatimonadota bacterium]